MIEKNGYVIVEEGDTLSAIAKSQGKSVKEMMALNPSIRSADKILVGQKLKTATKLPEAQSLSAPSGAEGSTGITENEAPKTDTTPEPPEAKPTKREEAAKAIEETPDEPVSNTEKAECCCMIAPWEISEEKRSYVLKVTKVGQEKAIGDDNKMVDVSVRETPSDMENNKFVLHIVAPEPDKEGKATYKKITSTHTFLRPKCDLHVEAFSHRQKKVIQSGQPFEIDSDGNIKGAVGREKQAQTPVFANACVTGKDPYAELKKIDEEIAYWKNHPSTGTLRQQLGLGGEGIAPKEAYFAQCRLEVARLKRQALLGQTPVYGEDATNIFDFLGMIFAPNKYEEIALIPTGSTKCTDQPKAYLYLHPYFKIKGAASFSVASYYTSGIDLESKSAEVTGGSKEIKGELEIVHGTRTLLVSNTITMDKAPQKIPLGTKIQDPASFFGPLASSVSKVYKVAEASKAMSAKRKGIFKDTGSYSFDPGKTKYELVAEDLMLYEDPKSHEVYWKGKTSFGITLFDGVNVTLDLLPYVIGVGGPIAKLIEKALTYGIKENDVANGKLKLEFTIDGKAGGKVELEFKDKETVTSTGKVEGTVGFSIEGLAEVGLDVFGVEAGAGAGFKAASSTSSNDSAAIICELGIAQAKQGEMPTFTGDISTNGLSIYYAWYKYVKTDEKDQNKDEGGQGIKKAIKHAVSKPELTYKAEDAVVLIEPMSFIDEIKKHAKGATV